MNSQAPKLADLKTKLRRAAKQRRDNLQIEADLAAEQAAGNFMERIALKDASIVAGYAAHRSELNVWPLMHLLHNAGTRCCLPVLGAAEEALQFRHWRPDMALSANHLSILEPGQTADRLQPSIVVTPLLAFDRHGHRLGYGGGYYDRTLQELRSAGKVTAVGFGFGAQEVDEVPADDFDQRLDWIVTDAEAIRVEG